MTSPVDTSVKLFWSGMSNVPVLNGQPGSLLGILDACLVTGCDIKPLTGLSVTGGVATATFAGQHSAQVDSVILIEGVTGALAGLNGEQKVTARPTANTLTFATTEPAGVADGAITIKLAPAGWAKPFTSGNIAVYTSTDPQSLGMFLRVDDTGTTSARVVGYESMLDINTGSGLFPTDAMVAGGGYWNKSYVTSTIAIPWVLAADSRMLLLLMSAGITNNSAFTGGCVYAFGDPIALKPGGDAYTTILSCDNTNNYHRGGVEYGAPLMVAVARAFNGFGGSVWHGSYPYNGNNTSISGNDNWGGAFPNPITGELLLSKRYLAAGTNQPQRAEVPGVYTVPQSGLLSFFNTGNTVAAAGTLKGRNLFAVTVYDMSAALLIGQPNGVVFIDQTGPWR